MNEGGDCKTERVTQSGFDFKETFGQNVKVEKKGEQYMILGVLEDGLVPGGQTYCITAKEKTIGEPGETTIVMEAEEMNINGSNSLRKKFNKVWFWNVPSEQREVVMTSAGYSGINKEAVEDFYRFGIINFNNEEILLISRFRKGDAVAALYHEAGHVVVSQNIPGEMDKRVKLAELAKNRFITQSSLTKEEIELEEWYVRVEIQASTEAVKIIEDDRHNGIDLFPGDEELMRVKNMYTMAVMEETKNCPELKPQLNKIINQETHKFSLIG